MGRSPGSRRTNSCASSPTRCVAATVYDEHAEPLGAISLAGPSSRLPDERIRQLGPVVAHTAEELTHKVGGRWPHPC